MTEGIEVTRNDDGVRFRLEAAGGASGLFVIPMAIRCGPADLSCGGIAGVGTDEAVRGQGLARRVLEASLEWMAQERLALAWLFGIENFYEKFGFVSLLPEVRTTFRTAELLTVPAADLVTGSPEAHGATCRAIWELRDAGRSGLRVRDRDWRWFRRGTRWRHPFSVQVGSEGYAVIDEPGDEGDALTVAEVGARPGALAALLGAIGHQAQSAGRAEVVIHAPAGFELDALARRLGARRSTVYRRTGGGMGRIVHWEQAVAQLAGFWASRPDVRLTLATELGGLRLAGGRAEPFTGRAAVTLPQHLLLQALCGYCGGLELAGHPAVAADAGDRATLARLFPAGAPYHWEPDKF